jgi:hypothetical protein
VNRTADVRETQETEGFRLPLPIPLAMFGGVSPKLNQARLFRMQFQPIFPQSLPQLL